MERTADEKQFSNTLLHENKNMVKYFIRRGEETMQIYEELVARGLIAQVTNEEEIKNM